MVSKTLGLLALRFRRAVKSSPQLVALVRGFNASRLKLVGNKRLWSSGLGHEYLFWHYRVSSDPEEMRLRLSKDRELPQYVGDVIDRCGFSKVRLLDVGCGPAMLGVKWKNAEIRLTAADPLAARYNHLIKEQFGNTGFRIEEVRAEELCGPFGAESFDIVHASNAIDHCESPVLALQQMLAVTRAGGAVVCRHYRNEGHTNAYTGLHQWNFDLEDGRPAIWSPVSRCCPLDHLGPDVRFEGRAQGRMIHWLFFKAQGSEEP